MGKRLLLLALVALAGCGAPAAAIPPTVQSSATTQPSTTVAPPTRTAAPPTATAEAASATVEQASATAPLPTAASSQSTAVALPSIVASDQPVAATILPVATAAPPTAIPAPVATQREPVAAVRLVIPAIGLDRKLVSVGLDRNRVPVVPNHDVGWYNLSAGPGMGENIVLWGHVLRFKATPKIAAPFARLKELQVGAALTLYGSDGEARQYEVIEQVWVTPDQVSYILPKGRELVTMVSCIGEKVVAGAGVEMTHRLITIAAPTDG